MFQSRRPQIQNRQKWDEIVIRDRVAYEMGNLERNPYRFWRYAVERPGRFQ